MRVFTAVAFPQSVKSQLADLCHAEIPTARWVHPDDFHLTLRFIGNAEGDTLKRYKGVLEQIQSEPFEITLKGVGRFPENTKKPPRVLWVDVVKPPELITLQKNISDGLEAEGLKPDHHPNYSPHITLARLKTNYQLPELDVFLKEYADFELSPFTVNAVTLYQSKRNANGGNYTPIETYSF